MLWATVVLVAAFGAVFAQRIAGGLAPAWDEWELCLGWLGLLFALHFCLGVLHCRGDEKILPLVGMLTGLGVVLKYRLGFLSAADLLGPRSLIYLVSAASLLLTFLLFRRRGLVYLQRFYPLSALLGLGVLALILVYGSSFRGARFGPLLTTPSEALKVLLVIYLAGFLSRKGESFQRTVCGLPRPPLSAVLPFVMVWSLPQILFACQHDLGLIVLFALLVIVLFYIATGRLGYLFVGGLATALMALVIYHFQLHGKARINAWWDPWSDPLGTGWQTVQALFALRAGAWDGMGLGAGSPDRIPVVESDFIYAALAEELGLLGTGLILACYLLLFWRGFLLAMQTEDRFLSLLVAGFTSILAIQTFLNVGGVIKLVPITGITLPFISHGGSSLLTCYTMVGLLLAISDQTATEAEGQADGDPSPEPQEPR